MLGHGDATDASDAGPSVTCVTIDSERRRALTGHADGSATLWDVETAETERSLKLHDRAMFAAMLTTDGQFVISADARAVRVSSVDGETSEAVLSSPAGVMRFIGLAKLSDRPVAIARSFDGRTLRVVDVSSGSLLLQTRDADERIAQATFLQNASALTLSDTGNLNLWLGEDRTPLCTALPASSQLASSSSAHVGVLGTPDGRLLAWDLTTHDQLFETLAHAGSVRSLAFDESGSHLVTVANDGSLWLGCARTGEHLGTWKTTGSISCCAATSRISAIDVAYRSDAFLRAAVMVVVGTDVGDVQFITCAGLVSSA